MVSQPFVARLIVRFPIGRFVAIATILWGAVLMTIAASRSFASLMVIRAIVSSLYAAWLSVSYSPLYLAWMLGVLYQPGLYCYQLAMVDKRRAAIAHLVLGESLTQLYHNV